MSWAKDFGYWLESIGESITDKGRSFIYGKESEFWDSPFEFITHKREIEKLKRELKSSQYWLSECYQQREKLRAGLGKAIATLSSEHQRNKRDVVRELEELLEETRYKSATEIMCKEMEPCLRATFDMGMKDGAEAWKQAFDEHGTKSDT